MRECYMVCFGEYSDYGVHAVYESKEDALAYVIDYNRTRLTEQHTRNVSSDYTPLNTQYKCRDPIEGCPRCGKWWNEPESGEYYIMSVDFHPVGEPAIPDSAVPIPPVEKS